MIYICIQSKTDDTHKAESQADKTSKAESNVQRIRHVYVCVCVINPLNFVALRAKKKNQAESRVRPIKQKVLVMSTRVYVSTYKMIVCV